MTTLALAVASGGDDGFFNANGFASSSLTVFGCGDQDSADYDYRAFIRFTNATIPQGATINSATLGLTGQSSAGIAAAPAATKVSAEAADNPSVPSSQSNMLARSRTTSVGWTVSSWSTGVNTSPDLSAVVQQVVNRAGWVSGNALQLFWEPAVTGWGGAESFLSAFSYESGNVPALTIDYTPGSTGPETHSGTGTAVTATATLTVGTGIKAAGGTGSAVTATAALGTGVGSKPFTVAATVDGRTVTLTWDAATEATGYAVRRDGVTVAFDFTATTYTETLTEAEDGTHTYEVGVIL